MSRRAVTRLSAIAAVLVLAGCAGGSVGSPPINRSSNQPRSTPSSPDFPSTTAESSTTRPSTPPGSKGIAAPTRAELVRSLRSQVTGQRVTVVPVPGGFEAASWNQRGMIDFWHNDGSSLTWEQIGQSVYPYVPQLGPPHASVRGALLRGMQDATFIVYGVFTGDGSGNAVAFTTGQAGWGVIKAEPSGNIGPSGEPVGTDQIGLSYNFGFAGGDLVTEDCPLNRPISECGAHPIVKRWAWNGTDFSLV